MQSPVRLNIRRPTLLTCSSTNILHPLYARVNAKLKMSAMSLLSDNFFSFIFQKKIIFLAVRVPIKQMTGVCECLCICVWIVQHEKENLEEKPFTLPTDSPVSTLIYWYVDQVCGLFVVQTTKFLKHNLCIFKETIFSKSLFEGQISLNCVFHATYSMTSIL